MKNHNAKYAFYYLLSLAALIFTALSVQMIIFGIIDHTVVDAVNLYGSVDRQLKFAISALFIAGPIYFYLTRLINLGLRKDELELESPLRRWLTYFIILVASVIILGVFVTVINNFLSGELTTRFILKAASMLIMAAAVFSYYFYDMKRTSAKKDRVLRLFGWIAAALVLAVFVSAWFFVESPKLARAKRLDQIVMNYIYQLENSVNSYYTQYGRLPESLDEIKATPDIYFDPSAQKDPETGEAIVYRKEGEEKFSFCATFRVGSDEQTDNSRPYAPGNKVHGAGFNCIPGMLWGKDDSKDASTKAIPVNPVD
ncbi:MAG: DUF5671 domain-containing protein [Bacillota bacterium]